MGKYKSLDIYRAALSFRQRLELFANLLLALLLTGAANSAWAIHRDSIASPQVNTGTLNMGTHLDYSGAIPTLDPFLSTTTATRLEQNYPSEVIHAIEAFPEVVVFPIRVAGGIDVSAIKSAISKITPSPGSGSIAVIYPDIGEPFRSVFTQIIDGIEDKTKGHVSNFAVGPNVNVGELNNSLRSQNTRVVIALGRQGVKVASALDSSIGIVVGGVLTATDSEVRNLQVNSLTPDPALLFSRLKGMMPKVRRVFTVYDPRQNAWMIRLAKEAARAQGLELTVYDAQDLRSAMLAYHEILANTDCSQDALWLPQDTTTVEDSTVVPLVLKESWSRKLTVFSSSFDHVRRGVLFSLYPNNVELGRHLAASALGYLDSGENEGSGMVPLREVLMAVNLRTAQHLEFNASHTRNFDMAFPEK